jgi:two-component system response regulator PilR (NtrC family)
MGAARQSSPILGESKAVQDLLKLIEKVSASKTGVLIIGESGTGKELVARMIHESGPMKGKPFVPVNCGAIPENLIETEMFGHKRGSFTGAVSDKAGLFEVANTGTLFLDEVGELPLSMQVKLLRAIQDRKIRRVGANEDMSVDIRIIAATNRDLEAAVKAGTFREDLYYRLNVLLIKTPPLRERPGDVEILADFFLKRFAQRLGRKVEGFSADAMQAIKNYRWPGNVRELENVMERAITLENTEQVSLSSLPPQLVEGLNLIGAASSKKKRPFLPDPDFATGPIGLEEILGEVERFYVESALKHTGGVKKRAADLLGITFRSMRYRLEKLGMDSDGE